MRELYFVTCGIVLGITLRDWLEAHEQRIAWKAADLVREEEQRRRAWEKENPVDTPVDTPAATPA
jgi:hypothetical protein